MLSNPKTSKEIYFNAEALVCWAFAFTTPRIYLILLLCDQHYSERQRKHIKRILVIQKLGLPHLEACIVWDIATNNLFYDDRNCRYYWTRRIFGKPELWTRNRRDRWFCYRVAWVEKCQLIILGEFKCHDSRFYARMKPLKIVFLGKNDFWT